MSPSFSASKKQQDLDAILHIALPSVCGLIIPMSLLNIVVNLNLGITRSPSTLIYTALIVMDLLNAITGSLITADPDMVHWKGLESNIYLFTFDATVVLLFGLAVVRVACIRMSALRVLSNFKTLAYCVVVSSLLFGAFCVVYPRLYPKGDLSIQKFLWLDVLDLLLAVGSVSLTMYTYCSVRARRSLLNTSTYKSASAIALAISLNFIVSYSYYAFLNIARIYLVVRDEDCPPDSWIEVFVCDDSLMVGVTAMCVQSLVNNIILLCQKQVRRFLVEHVLMCARDCKFLCATCTRCCHGDNNYQYFEDYAW